MNLTTLATILYSVLVFVFLNPTKSVRIMTTYTNPGATGTFLKSTVLLRFTIFGKVGKENRE